MDLAEIVAGLIFCFLLACAAKGLDGTGLILSEWAVLASGTLEPKGISEVMLLNRGRKGKKYLKLGKRIRQHLMEYLGDGEKSENQADKHRLQKA